MGDDRLTRRVVGGTASAARLPLAGPDKPRLRQRPRALRALLRAAAVDGIAATATATATGIGRARRGYQGAWRARGVGARGTRRQQDRARRRRRRVATTHK
eukprot:scaffold412_cov388-Prasinococcus_capsulatus_cf.AAC.34